MKTYTVIVPITRASGQQTYTVEAESPEDAKKLVNTGNIECDSEEIEVENVAGIDEWEVYPTSAREDNGRAGT